MQSVYRDQLWIGHAGDAREPRGLFAAGVEAVVDVAYEEPPAALPRGLIYCRFPLNDGGNNREPILALALQTIVDLLTARLPTLVACSAGLSRSPALAAVALGAHLGRPPHELLEEFAARRTLEVHPLFWEAVQHWKPQRLESDP